MLCFKQYWKINLFKFLESIKLFTGKTQTCMDTFTYSYTDLESTVAKYYLDFFNIRHLSLENYMYRWFCRVMKIDSFQLWIGQWRTPRDSVIIYNIHTRNSLHHTQWSTAKKWNNKKRRIRDCVGTARRKIWVPSKFLVSKQSHRKLPTHS